MKKGINKEEAIRNLLNRNVENVMEQGHLENALRSGKKLRVKFGIDPTSPDLHLGHAVVLRKLKEFQELGHKVVLLIGDFTAQIGDPSGRSDARKPLTAKEVKVNMKEYLAEAGKVLAVKKAEIVYNNSWYSKEGVAGLMRLAASATLQQILHRADFKKRIDENRDVTFPELFYPLFQGYDSVKVKADVELGGTDQLLNLLAGRKIQRHFGMKEQDVLTVPLLEGLDGEKKMSKSVGNYIGLAEPASEIFGKIMSIPDTLIEKYFLLCTEHSLSEIENLKKTLSPRDLKARLGFEIAKLYHDEAAAQKGQEKWEKQFVKKEVPDDVLEIKITKGASLAEKLVEANVIASKSEWRRLIEEGAVRDENNAKIIDQSFVPASTTLLKIGKRRFVRIIVSG